MKNIEMYNMLNEIEDESTEYYQKLVLGEQVYTTVLYMYLFLKVSANVKHCGILIRSVSKEELLYKFIGKLGIDEIWNSNAYGILSKIRKSYILLAIYYCNDGLDKVFATLQEVCDELFDKTIRIPANDYKSILEKYILETSKTEIHYKVKKEIQYSDKDIIFRASTFFENNTYSALGYSKRSAIEKLSKDILMNNIFNDEKTLYAYNHEFVIIEKEIFHCDSSNYYESQENVSKFADKYGVDHLLMRFALLLRTKSASRRLELLGIDVVSLFSDPYLVKRGLINLGNEILLLQTICYNLDHGKLDKIDLSQYDTTNIYIPPEDSHTQLIKIFNIDSFTKHLFDYLDVPDIDTAVTDKQIKEIICGFISVFFISNFSADKKFNNFFNNLLSTFYSDDNLKIELDYKLALIAYLSNFNIRARMNKPVIENNAYLVELTIGDGANALTYEFKSDESKHAKSEVWHLAYDKLVTSVQQFFFTSNMEDNKSEVELFVHRTCNNKIKPVFFNSYGIMNAKNFNKIDSQKCSKILNLIKNLLNNDTLFKKFTALIYKLNKDKYVCVDEEVFCYNDWIDKCIDKINNLPIESNTRLPEIYNKIVNPTENLQKKMISFDYKLVKRIYPLSDEVAIYALDKNIDAYNYLTIINPKVLKRYEQLKSNNINESIVDTFVDQIEENLTFTILNSQKPLHFQIRDLVSELSIEKIKIACGYCFASGIGLLKDIFESALSSNVHFELYIGSLQNYDESNNEKMITGIDKATVSILNTYLSNSNFELYTCPDRFYHGKIYFFEGKEESVVIVGSSNLSRSAFISNYELNLAFKMKNDHSTYKNFYSWINQLNHFSKRIEVLNEDLFGSNELKLDGSVLINRISKDSMQNKIRQLSNSEVQYRLNLWMSYSPDVIAEDLGILSLPNYFVFVYREHNLMVLESFEAGNAYFAIKLSGSFEDIINNISTFTKTEIFEYSQMSKRGYHVSNKFTMENNIRGYFK